MALNVQRGAPVMGMEIAQPYGELEVFQQNQEELNGRVTILEAPVNEEEVPPFQKAYEGFTQVCSLLTRKKQWTVFNQLLSVQEELARQEGPAQLREIKAMATCSYSFAVTAEKIYVLGGVIGQGSATTVYFSKEIDTAYGNPQQAKVLKKREADFETERRILEQLSPDSESGPGRAYNELFEASFVGSQGAYYAISSPSDGTLDQENYQEKENPVTEAIEKFIDYLSGIGTLHESGIIHRDIKPENLLSNVNKLTGYHLARREEVGEKRDNTAVDPFYAAPFIWNNILGQKDRRFGKQTKEADMFAIGRVIQYNVIWKIFDQLGNDDIHPILNRMSAKVHSLNCLSTNRESDHLLLELEKNYPNRVFHLGIDQDGRDEYLLFPTNDEIYEATLAGITLLKGTLSEQELVQLGGLAECAYRLQSSDPQRIPTYAQARAELEELLVEPPLDDVEEREQALEEVFHKEYTLILEGEAKLRAQAEADADARLENDPAAEYLSDPEPREQQQGVAPQLQPILQPPSQGEGNESSIIPETQPQSRPSQQPREQQQGVAPQPQPILQPPSQGEGNESSIIPETQPQSQSRLPQQTLSWHPQDHGDGEDLASQSTQRNHTESESSSSSNGDDSEFFPSYEERKANQPRKKRRIGH